MPTNEKTPPSPPAQPPAEAAQQAAAASKPGWEIPVGTGEPIDFDPAVHQPPLSSEELEEIFGKIEE